MQVTYKDGTTEIVTGKDLNEIFLKKINKKKKFESFIKVSKRDVQ